MSWKIDRLARRREKAMLVFQRAYNQLDAATDELAEEIAKSEEHLTAVKSEYKSTISQADRLRKFINGAPE